MGMEVSLGLLRDVTVKAVDSSKVPLYVGEKRKLQVVITGTEDQTEVSYLFYKDGASSTEDAGEPESPKEVEDGVVVLEPQDAGKHILEVHVLVGEEKIIRKFSITVRS